MGTDVGADSGADFQIVIRSNGETARCQPSGQCAAVVRIEAVQAKQDETGPAAVFPSAL